MKKLLLFISTILLTIGLVGCSSNNEKKAAIDTEKLDEKNPVTIKIGATNVPHAEILEYIAPKLLKEGIKLDIVTYQDYYLPNKNLADKEIDLNYFQHIPFFDLEVKEKGYKLENAAAIHIEPIGLYSKKIKSLDELKDGANILLSNSKSDWGRVLSILSKKGVIKLKDGVKPEESTFEDIAENPKNLKFKYDNDPAIMAQYYNNNEGDLVVINSNFAVDAGINPTKDAIVLENAENNPYANIVAVREGDKDKLVIKKIIEALKSDDVKSFIKDKYKGAVIPA